MSHFVRHEPCPNCGSKDNLARYSDGGAFCFGCHYRERGDVSYIHNSQDVVPKQHQGIPDDFNREFSDEVLTWCGKYGILVPELIFRDVGYSQRYNQLIFTFKLDNKVVVWQARNFNPSKLKYYTSGEKDGILPIYPTRELTEFSRNSVRDFLYPEPSNIECVDPVCDVVSTGRNVQTLVIVEDCMSAIKIARQCDSMPLLGATLNPNRLAALRGLYGRLIVWLDENKYDNAIKICQQASLLGFNARPVYTEDDPKCFDDSFIREVIK